MKFNSLVLNILDGGNLEDFFISHKKCNEQVNFEENGRALIGEKGEKGENYFLPFSSHILYNA